MKRRDALALALVVHHARCKQASKQASNLAAGNLSMTVLAPGSPRFSYCKYIRACAEQYTFTVGSHSTEEEMPERSAQRQGQGQATGHRPSVPKGGNGCFCLSRSPSLGEGSSFLPF